MAIRSRETLVGAWAFLIGIILAILMGIITGATLVSLNSYVLLILVVLGIIVGYFVSETDIKTFLFASMVLVIVCFAGIGGITQIAGIIGVSVSGISIVKVATATLGTLLFLFVPATIVVAIKTVFSLATS